MNMKGIPGILVKVPVPPVYLQVLFILKNRLKYKSKLYSLSVADTFFTSPIVNYLSLTILKSLKDARFTICSPVSELVRVL